MKKDRIRIEGFEFNFTNLYVKLSTKIQASKQLKTAMKFKN